MRLVLSGSEIDRCPGEPCLDLDVKLVRFFIPAKILRLIDVESVTLFNGGPRLCSTELTMKGNSVQYKLFTFSENLEQNINNKYMYVKLHVRKSE